MSLETKLCLSASITCAHESGHLLEKLSFFLSGERGRRGLDGGARGGGSGSGGRGRGGNTLNLHPGINLQNAIQA